MRSPLEIWHRSRQEFQNLRLLLTSPFINASITNFNHQLLPEPRWLATTPFAGTIRSLADRILQHRFPIFATEIDAGPDIEWRRDYVSNKTTGLAYFRLIPYLDFERAGDHKWIWELNRHQHLVVLAQAFLLCGEREYLYEIESELKSWIAQNPYQRGINWASALEVAFRATSWLWVLHLAGEELSLNTRRQLVGQVYLHGLHLANNLSFYFSPNTHLLGESVALHAIAVLLPGLPGASKWKLKADRVIEQQMQSQVQSDGSHFEQSTYYHVYALDMFLFHAAVSNVSAAYKAKLALMAGYLDSLLGPDRCLPFFGDDDGGRWFHPYGDRSIFGRATLAAANCYFGEKRWAACEPDYWEQACWWFPSLPGTGAATTPPRSQLFREAGTAILISDSTKIVVDCGAFGRGSGGHSHADTLSLTITQAEQEILIDPGTFTYVGDLRQRNAFRGTAAHSTLRVDARDQADPVNPFRWENPPAVSTHRWSTTDTEDILDAECTYRGIRHRRYVHLVKPHALLIVDVVNGSPGEHLVEQFWHLASEQYISLFRFPLRVEQSPGRRSRCFGQQEPAPVLVARRHATLPVIMPAAVRLSESAEIDITLEDGGVRFRIAIAPQNREIIVNCPSNLR
jgi:hypothetical protein